MREFVRGFSRMGLRAIASLALLSLSAQAQTTLIPVAQKVSNYEPLACLSIGSPRSLCSGPIGTWQISRLAGSARNLALALKASGMTGEIVDIERRVVADSIAYGPEFSIGLPALVLLEASAFGGNPRQ